MANKVMTEFAQERGLLLREDTAVFQAQEGYLFSYAHFPNLNNWGVIIPVDAETYTKEKFKALRKAVKPHKFTISAYNAKMITIAAPGVSKKKRFAMMDTITQVLRAEMPKLGIAPRTVCEVCGQPGCDDQWVQAMICQPVHNTCKVEKAAEILAEVEHNEKTGSMILGLPGAILGAIVGALPVLLVMLLFKTMFMILFALIPMGAYWGYSKTRGKLNAVVPFLTGILSFITTIFAIAAYYLVLGMREFPGNPIGAVWSLTMRYARSAFVEDLIFALLSCLVGVIFSWSYTSQNNKKKIKEAERILSEQDK